MVFSSGIYIIQASFQQDNFNLGDAFAGAVKQRNTVGLLSDLFYKRLVHFDKLNS